jgi:hypothetical protein
VFNDPNGADPDQVHNQLFRPVIGDNGTAGGPSMANDFSTLFDMTWGTGGYDNVGGIANGFQAVHDYYTMSNSAYQDKYATYTGSGLQGISNALRELGSSAKITFSTYSFELTVKDVTKPKEDDPNAWIASSVAKAFFGLQMGKYGDKIDWKVDLMMASGTTGRLPNGSIQITIGVGALLDPTLAYLTIGHELIHAEDYLNGNYDAWRSDLDKAGYTGDLLNYSMQTVMEYHAYQWDANLESQFRVNYGAQSEFNTLTNTMNDYGLMYLFNK